MEFSSIQRKEQAELDQSKYDRLLLRWKNKDHLKKNPLAKDWRGKFVARLISENRKWKDLIATHAGARKDDVKALLASAGGDPLRFLDRLGVSVRVVLNQLDSLQDTTDAKRITAGVLTLRSTLISDSRLFKEAGERLALYATVIGNVGYAENAWPVSVQDRLPLAVDPLKKVARFLKQLTTLDLAGPIHTKRGAPSKEHLRWTIGKLVAICESQLKRQFGKNAGGIALATIAAILKCGFPEHFKGEKPVRVVTDAYRQLRNTDADGRITVPIRQLDKYVVELLTVAIPAVKKTKLRPRKTVRAGINRRKRAHAVRLTKKPSPVE
jgi:hypothetical protein